MERPNKEDYDFNDVFEGVRFASNMIKYADYLEAKQLPIHVVSGMFSEKQMEEAWADGCGCGESRSGYFDIENYR